MSDEKFHKEAAIIAMHALLSASAITYTSPKEIAKKAVAYADALLLELDTRDPSWEEVRRHEE